ncbi:MAG: serine hydrolase [Elainellaceae cyanobacterium]
MAELGGRSRRSHQHIRPRVGPVPSRPSSLGRQPAPRRQVINLPPAAKDQLPGAAEDSAKGSANLRLLNAAPSNRSSPPRQASALPLQKKRSTPPLPSAASAKPSPHRSSPSTPRRRRPQISNYASAFGGRRQPVRQPSRQLGRQAHPARQDAALTLQHSNRGAIARRKAPHLTPLPSRPAPASPRRDRQQRPRQRPRPQRRSTPRWLYALRLLILGLGVGAIAGTLISALNPAQQMAQQRSSASPSAPSSEGGTAAAAEGSNAAASALGTIALGAEMTTLKTDITEAIAAYPDLSPGVMILDLDTGDYVDIRANAPIAAASTIKVPILVAFLQSVEAGSIGLSDRLTMEEADIVGEAGEMQLQPAGTTYSALETADLMITISDNTATNILIRKLGGQSALNQRFSQWGLTQTQIAQPLPDIEGQNTTTPMEMVTLLTSISNGNLLSSRSRDRMFDILRNTRTDSLLPQGIPPDAAIAHKTGTIGQMLGDVGIIDTPQGNQYAIAVMVKRPHDDERAADLIRQVSTLTYDAFSADKVSL